MKPVVHSMYGGNVSYQLWVGNIPFDSSEEELRAFLSTAGHVQNIRIKYDLETGKSKGFAFVEYLDAETCQLALKRISGTELRGRKIRLDWATEELRRLYGGGSGGLLSSRERRDRHERSDRFGEKFSSFFPPHLREPPVYPSVLPTQGELSTLSDRPPGEAGLLQAPPLPSGGGAAGMEGGSRNGYAGHRATLSLSSTSLVPPSSTKAMSEHQEGSNASKESTPENPFFAEGWALQVIEIVQTLTTAQLLYIVGHIQKLAAQQPDEARHLLTTNIELTYALVHALFLLNMNQENFSPLSAEELSLAEMNRQERQAQLAAAGVHTLPVVAPPPASDVPPPTQPAPALVSEALIDELLNSQNKELLTNLINVTPEYLGSLPAEERQRVTEIHAALRRRGVS